MSLRAIGLALIIALVLPCGATAEAVPDAAALQAKIVAANGTSPSTFVQTIVSRSPDRESVETVYQDGDNFRALEDDGPIHVERGVNHGAAWHLNENGIIVAEENPSAAEAPEEQVQTVTRQSRPFDAYVVATLGANGYGTREFVDPVTYRIVEEQQHTANGDVTTTYDDFRTIAGVTLAFHWKTNDAVSRVTTDFQRTRFTVGSVTAADLAPPVRRPFVEFPNGTTSAELPVRFVGTRLVATITIAGKPEDVVLDSDSDVAKANNLPLYNRESSITASRYESAQTIVPEIRFGPLVMHNVVARVAPDREQPAPGVTTVGLLGFDFFAAIGVTIDYQHQRVVAVAARDYASPAGVHRLPLDVRVESDVPVTTLVLNGAVAQRFMIDTGGESSFVIFDYFARRHPDALYDDGGIGAHSKPLRLTGLGGAFDTKAYAIASLQLGGIDFKDFVGYRVASQSSFNYDLDGLVGAGLLKLFTVGFDLPNRRIDLVPNDEGLKLIHFPD